MKPIAYTRAAQLPQMLRERIVILDGAMGTMIQRYKLGEADYRGERFKDHGKDLKGNNELLQFTRPDVIREIHEQYLEAGADLIETNTFGATSVAQEDYQLAHVAREMNVAAARLAREACDKYSTPEKPRFAAGALGPTPRTASISPDVNDPAARNVSFDQLKDAYYEQASGLLEGGADLFLVETIFDTLNAKAAIFALDELMETTGERLPVIISGTVTDASGRILSGQTVTAFWNSLPASSAFFFFSASAQASRPDRRKTGPTFPPPGGDRRRRRVRHRCSRRTARRGLAPSSWPPSCGRARETPGHRWSR